jgi:hypothetical protein
MFILPRPIKTRYVKFNNSFENPAYRPRCLSFNLYGCKFTRKDIIDYMKINVLFYLNFHWVINANIFNIACFNDHVDIY